MKPVLRLEDEQLPAIKNWEVGKTYTVLVTMKQIAKHEKEDECCGEFEVLKVKDMSEKKEFDRKSVESAIQMKKKY